MNSKLESIRVVTGDITRLNVDAVANAANERMLGGGGVDGAIHRAAGPELRELCASFKEVRPGVRCQTGDARITQGFNLKAKYVIHTVGPVYSDRFVERCAVLLASAYRSALELVAEHDIQTIAFPCISTGVYGYPFEDAARIAIKTVKDWLKETDFSGEVQFCCFSPQDTAIYERLLAEG